VFGGPDPVGGLAEIAGYNFMVTNQHFGNQTCFFGTQVDFCKGRDSALFMHELGHNLDLCHGGDEDQNYKINYVSVMNYQFNSGISYMAPGDTYKFGSFIGPPPISEMGHLVGERLDYSSGGSATLDEYHLNETLGVGGPTTSDDVTFYWSCGIQLLMPCQQGFIRVAAAPFDWNNNGAIENDVAADINYYYPDGQIENTLTEMHDFDDWGHIHQFLQTPRYRTGRLPAVEIRADPVLTH